MAANVQKIDLVDIDLNSGNISRSWLNHTIGMADNKGNAFGVRVFRDGEAVTLSSVSVQGHFRDPHGTNISITDSSLVSVSGNVAYVVLPQACYNYEGQFCLAIKLVGGGVTGTMRIVDGMVSNTNTSNPVTPTTVPTYQEVLALYNDMQAATAVANAAIAPEYDDLDFPVYKGQLCIYNGGLYRAKQNISSSEDWTSSHWEATTFGDEMQGTDLLIQNDIATIYNELLAYDAGKIVVKDGVTYILPNGHTAGTAWASTTKTIINIADHFTEADSDLKSAFDSIEPTKILPTAVGQISRIAKKINTNGIIEASGNSIVLPIIADRNYIVYTTNQWGSNFALLTSNVLVNGEEPDYATGYTGFVALTKNTKVSFLTPSDARFIMLRCDDNTAQNDLHLIEYINLNQLDNNLSQLDNAVVEGKSAFDSIKPTKIMPTAVGQISRVAFNIDANGVMKTTGNSIVVPIVPKRFYTVISTDQNSSNYALLQNNNLVANESPDYATGYSGRVMMTRNVLYRFETPDDARFIILRCDSDAGQNAITLTEYYSIAEIENDIVENKAFDLTGYSRENAYIDANNVWADGGRASLTAMVPVIPRQRLTLKTTYPYGSVYALLKDSSMTIGGSPSFCTGHEGRVLFNSNTLVSLDIPSDCRYLAVRADKNALDSAFEIATSTKITDIVQFVSYQAAKINMGTNTVYVAASDSTDNDKRCADFVCTGTNDEVTIQNAVNSVHGVMPGASIVLMSGHYNIDSFPNTNYDGHVAIMLPSKSASDTIGTDVYSVMIKGAVYNSENVVIQVSQAAYDAMNTTDNYSVFAAANDWYYNHYSFHDLRVYVPSAQKKIVCYDGRRMGSMECRRLKAVALDHATWDTPVEEIVLPNFHSIGVIGACWDSNSWNNTWEAVYCIGFGQGFAVSGEHLLLIKCVAIYGRYGFTFDANLDAARVEQGLTPSHPNMLIGCSDEANANFWLFGGGNVRRPVINCYDLSIEYWPNWFSIDGGGHFATEEEPGQFSGHISYAISGGDAYTKWWADDGSGKNFDTVNLNQSKSTTSAIRETYAPNIGQIVYDTTLNKAVICTDPATKEWRDMNGNVIS